MTQPAPSLAALLLADSRLPVGGYTVSGGLEPALLGGMSARDVPAFIAMRLATVARVEAGTAVVAAAAVRSEMVLSDASRSGMEPPVTVRSEEAMTTAMPTDAAQPEATQSQAEPAATPSTMSHSTPGATRIDAQDVAWAWAARTPVAAVRESSVAQGRAMLRLVRRLRPDGPAATWLDRLPRTLTTRAVVLGAFAGELGLDGASVARVVGYDDVQSVTAAALKLEPLDPVDAVAWTLDAAAHLDDLVAACAHLTAPHDIPAHSAPQLEAWHAAHAATERKLFRV